MQNTQELLDNAVIELGQRLVEQQKISDIAKLEMVKIEGALRLINELKAKIADPVPQK